MKRLKRFIPYLMVLGFCHGWMWSQQYDMTAANHDAAMFRLRGHYSLFEQFVPPAVGAYVNAGSGWNPLAGTGSTGALPFTPPPAALYCISSGAWVPCTGTGGGGGGTFPSGTGIATVNAGAAWGLTLPQVPVESYGAVSYSSASAAIAGTDSTTAIRTCVNISGSECLFQAGYYKITNNIPITVSGTSVKGAFSFPVDTGLVPTITPTVILQTSATADFFDVAGTDTTHNIASNQFEDLTLERSVLPTGGATNCISLNFTYAAYINRVVCADSNHGFHWHASGSQGVGVIENSAVMLGYNGLTETTGNHDGFFADSVDGIASPSFRLRHDFVGVNPSVTATTKAYNITGGAVQDQMYYGVESAGASYGAYISCTGTSFDNSADIHFIEPVFDQSKTSSIFIQNCPASATTQIDFNGGYALTTQGTVTNNIDVESSDGVSISKMQIYGTVPVEVYAHSSTNASITNNQITLGSGKGVVFDGTVSSLINGNQLSGLSGATVHIGLVNSASGNVVGGNTLSGTGTFGISPDSSSQNNIGLQSNIISVSGTPIATPTTPLTTPCNTWTLGEASCNQPYSYLELGNVSSSMTDNPSVFWANSAGAVITLPTAPQGVGIVCASGIIVCGPSRIVTVFNSTFGGSAGNITVVPSSGWSFFGTLSACTSSVCTIPAGGSITFSSLNIPSSSTLDWFPVAFSGLGAGGFPITIGSTSIAANSTTTTIAGLSLTAPNIGAATATSLLASDNVDGTAPMTITTGTSASLGGTFKSGYTLNAEATAAAGVAYTLPTAAAGLQYCVGNSWNGSAATTGILTVNASASGQFIIFTDGTLSATGGNVTSGGAAADFACFVGVDSTHWYFKPSSGTWVKH